MNAPNVLMKIDTSTPVACHSHPFPPFFFSSPLASFPSLKDTHHPRDIRPERERERGSSSSFNFVPRRFNEGEAQVEGRNGLKGVVVPGKNFS